jgi:hypothetical protein
MAQDDFGNILHIYGHTEACLQQLFRAGEGQGLFCPHTEPCCQETIDNEGPILSMLEQQENMRIPLS